MVRVFKNKVSMEVVGIEKRGNAKCDDIKHLVSGARGRKVFEQGDLDQGVWTAGLVMGLIDDIPTCKELCQRMSDEAAAILSKAHSMIVSKSKL